MKKAGTVVDDYKLPIFRTNLNNAGFTHRTEVKFTKDTTIITIHFEPERLEELTKVIQKSELDAKRSN